MVDLPEGIEAVRTALHVITWNVWFDDFEFELRAKSIFKTCKDLDPDVICFQEVLPQFVEFLAQEKWIKQYKVSSDVYEWSVSPYGVIILAKAKLKPVFEIHDMNTVMDRKFVTVELKVNNRALFVGTAHLESLKFKEIRRDQLVRIASLTAKHENALIVGDFNFCSYRNFIEGGDLENNVLLELLPDYKDMWPEFWDTDECKGFTYDSERNPMITHEERMRYDRILYKLSSPSEELSDSWWPQWIKLIGTEPIRTLVGRLSSKESKMNSGGLASPLRAAVNEISAVLPSDHFGLHGCFELHSYGQQGDSPDGSGKKREKCCVS